MATSSSDSDSADIPSVQSFQNDIDRAGRKITRIKIFYTPDTVTNLEFKYRDGPDQKLVEGNHEIPHTRVEELELAEDEEIISVWCDRKTDGKGFHRLLVGTSYGRVTKLCGKTSPSEFPLQSLHLDGQALSGFSVDGSNVLEWAPRTTCFRVDSVMTMLEVSISQYEKSLKRLASNEIDSGIGIVIYKDLVNSIISVITRFISDHRTLKLLIVGNREDRLGDLGRRNRTIKYYTDECYRQLQDIATRFGDLFLVIRGTRAGPERIQIFEELSVTSSVHVISSHFTQWQGWVIDCKNKLVHGLEERVKIAKAHYETMQNLHTESKKTRSLCSCTKSLVLCDYEAEERAKITFQCAEERLEVAMQERAALEADFARLLSRVATWESQTTVHIRTIAVQTAAPDTSDIPEPQSWPPSVITPDLSPDGFWEKIREIWKVASDVREIQQYLKGSAEIQEIWKTLEITITLVPSEPFAVVETSDWNPPDSSLNTEVSEVRSWTQSAIYSSSGETSAKQALFELDPSMRMPDSGPVLH